MRGKETVNGERLKVNGERGKGRGECMAGKIPDGALPPVYRGRGPALLVRGCRFSE